MVDKVQDLTKGHRHDGADSLGPLTNFSGATFTTLSANSIYAGSGTLINLQVTQQVSAQTGYFAGSLTAGSLAANAANISGDISTVGNVYAQSRISANDAVFSAGIQALTVNVSSAGTFGSLNTSGNLTVASRITGNDEVLAVNLSTYTLNVSGQATVGQLIAQANVSTQTLTVGSAQLGFTTNISGEITPNVSATTATIASAQIGFLTNISGIMAPNLSTGTLFATSAQVNVILASTGTIGNLSTGTLNVSGFATFGAAQTIANFSVGGSMTVQSTITCANEIILANVSSGSLVTGSAIVSNLSAYVVVGSAANFAQFSGGLLYVGSANILSNLSAASIVIGSGLAVNMSFQSVSIGSAMIGGNLSAGSVTMGSGIVAGTLSANLVYAQQVAVATNLSAMTISVASAAGGLGIVTKLSAGGQAWYGNVNFSAGTSFYFSSDPTSQTLTFNISGAGGTGAGTNTSFGAVLLQNLTVSGLTSIGTLVVTSAVGGTGIVQQISAGIPPTSFYGIVNISQGPNIILSTDPATNTLTIAAAALTGSGIGAGANTSFGILLVTTDNINSIFNQSDYTLKVLGNTSTGDFHAVMTSAGRFLLGANLGNASYVPNVSGHSQMVEYFDAGTGEISFQTATSGTPSTIATATAAGLNVPLNVSAGSLTVGSAKIAIGSAGALYWGSSIANNLSVAFIAIGSGIGGDLQMNTLTVGSAQINTLTNISGIYALNLSTGSIYAGSATLLQATLGSAQVIQLSAGSVYAGSATLPALTMGSATATNLSTTTLTVASAQVGYLTNLSGILAENISTGSLYVGSTPGGSGIVTKLSAGGTAFYGNVNLSAGANFFFSADPATNTVTLNASGGLLNPGANTSLGTLIMGSTIAGNTLQVSGITYLASTQVGYLTALSGMASPNISTNTLNLSGLASLQTVTASTLTAGSATIGVITNTSGAVFWNISANTLTLSGQATLQTVVGSTLTMGSATVGVLTNISGILALNVSTGSIYAGSATLPSLTMGSAFATNISASTIFVGSANIGFLTALSGGAIATNLSVGWLSVLSAGGGTGILQKAMTIGQTSSYWGTINFSAGTNVFLSADTATNVITVGASTTLAGANTSVGTLLAGSATFTGPVLFSSAAGANNPKRELILTAGGALPLTTGPNQSSLILTNNAYNYLGYTRSDSAAVWAFTTPAELDPNTNASASVLWTCSAVTGNCLWNIGYGQVSTNAGASFNTSVLNISTTVVAAAGTALYVQQTVFTVSGLTPNLLTTFRLRRVGTDAGDTLSDEARALMVRIDFTTTK